MLNKSSVLFICFSSVVFTVPSVKRLLVAV